MRFSVKKSATRFEQVPLEIVKQIVGNADEQEQPVEKVRSSNLFEPSSKKSEPYSLSVVPERKTAGR
jgi:hypothetical protein